MKGIHGQVFPTAFSSLPSAFSWDSSPRKTNETQALMSHCKNSLRNKTIRGGFVRIQRCNLKNDRVISVHFQGKPFNITVIQVYAPTSNAEEAEVERFYEDLQYLLELNTQKRCPFHYRGLECKSRKSRNTWGNRQIWPWNKEWSRAKANRVLPREHTGHSKHPLPTTQEKTLHMDITRWSVWNQIDYILCSQIWRISIQPAKGTPRAEHVSGHELIIAKFSLKWIK